MRGPRVQNASAMLHCYAVPGSDPERLRFMDETIQFIGRHWRQAIEVIILWVIIYNTYLYFRARAGRASSRPSSRFTSA